MLALYTRSHNTLNIWYILTVSNNCIVFILTIEFGSLTLVIFVFISSLLKRIHKTATDDAIFNYFKYQISQAKDNISLTLRYHCNGRPIFYFKYMCNGNPLFKQLYH